MTMPLFNGAELLGGIAFILFGLSFSRQGMQSIAGERLKLLMSQLANRRIYALGADALAAMSLQSTKAVIQIALNFVKSGLMSLPQAFAVALGAEMGTALVIVLLSVRGLADNALYLIAAGLLAERINRSERLKQTGTVVLGLGLILFGMRLLYAVVQPLGAMPAVQGVFAAGAGYLATIAVCAALFTLIVRTTAVTVAFAIALASSGILPFTVGLAVVLGANLGSAVTVGRTAMRRGNCGRRLALFHAAVKLFGVVVALPLAAAIGGLTAEHLPGLVTFPADLASPMATGLGIAIAHLAFNMALAVLFLPVTGLASKLTGRIVRDRGAEEAETLAPKYLDEDALDTPMLAFAQAKREVMRIAKIAHAMFMGSLEPFRMDVDLSQMLEMAQAADDKIDSLEKAVRFYLARISKQNRSQAQADNEVALLTIAQAIEDIGDMIHRDLMGLARRKRNKLARFSEEGLGELRRLHTLVAENFDLAMTMLVRPHEEISRKMLRHERRLDEIEQEMRQAHLMRLHENIPETCETSTIHLEILNQIRSINSKLTKIVQLAGELA